jgi:DNA-binding Lrp family transcriptional regulator
VFDLVLTHLEPNTGAVTLTREEIADRVGAAPSDVSRIMSELERHKIIYRRRLKVAGMRGRGPVRYYLNPHVAWNGKLEVRTEEAKQAPLPFAVIEGGKAPDQ